MHVPGLALQACPPVPLRAASGPHPPGSEEDFLVNNVVAKLHLAAVGLRIVTQAPLAPRTRRPRDPAATRAAILDAARAIAAERGPEALTISDVAHRAGVNRVTLYQHFRTREDLIGAVIARVSDDVTHMLETQAPPGDGIRFMLDFMGDHPEVGRLWAYGFLSAVPVQDRGGWERYLRGIREFAESDKAAVGIDTEMFARILQFAVILWSVHASASFANADDRREQTARFHKELDRLLCFGAVRPGAAHPGVAGGDADQNHSITQGESK